MRIALHLNMKKNLSLIILATVLIALGFSACQQKSFQAETSEYKPLPKVVLFLTLKAVKTDNGLQTELIEQNVREDNNNPLGTGASPEGDTYRLQILDKKGEVLLTSTRKFEFKYRTDEGNPYTFLKFSESLPDGYARCIVGVKITDGVWQELYNAKLN